MFTLLILQHMHVTSCENPTPLRVDPGQTIYGPAIVLIFHVWDEPEVKRKSANIRKLAIFVVLYSSQENISGCPFCATFRHYSFNFYPVVIMNNCEIFPSRYPADDPEIKLLNESVRVTGISFYI